MSKSRVPEIPDAIYSIKMTGEYLSGVKAAAKRGCDMQKLRETVIMLAQGKTLPENMRDHALGGGYAGCRECHIEPNWLLVYMIDKKLLVLTLMCTGSHSDLFS